MATDEEIKAAAKAMRNSKAWPVVFGPGAAETLARAAIEAVDQMRAQSEPVSDAAPEMLAALEAALPVMIDDMRDGYERDDGKDAAAIKMIRAAIAKTKGQSETADAKEPLA